MQFHKASTEGERVVSNMVFGFVDAVVTPN